MRTDRLRAKPPALISTRVPSSTQRQLRHCVIEIDAQPAGTLLNTRVQWADLARDMVLDTLLVTLCFSAKWYRACISTEVLRATAMLSWIYT
jgi:hypothetical protein